MAKIEQDLLSALGQQEEKQTPPFVPRKPIPQIGYQRIDGERFHSPEFMRREWEHIWTKTWQVGCHVSELSEPGEFRVHSLGKESLLFVRGNDGVIRGFFNICQHRGNVLCQTSSGIMSKFTCPFHGWEWNVDGTLKKLSRPELFAQFKDGVPTGELDLPPLRTDEWGGWVWFNMDPHAMPLREYLGEAGRHLETYELEKFQLIDNKSFEWAGNWKHAHDAFNESYHFEALHSEFMNITEGYDVPIELLGMHSRMINFNLTVSELLDNPDEVTPLREKYLIEGSPLLKEYSGIKGYKGKLKDIHLEIIKAKRAIQDETYLPYKKMNDEQLVHQYHYTFFPGTTFTQSAEMSILFRYRPHPTDPGYCYYDFLITQHNPPGTPVPFVEHRLYRHDELQDYGAAFEGTFDPFLANVLKQDGSNMVTMQQGTASLGFRGMILGDQEVRLRHFHQQIDRCLMGDYPWHK
jgi:phenylpropionate dioxygenase-like ring-hydroxylating dioxygenase large terminal subunit